MEGFSAWDGTAFTQTMIFIPDSAANILNTPSGARAWSREGTGPYSLKSLLQLPSHLNPLGTQLITPHFANFSEVEAHFRQRRISLRLSLKSLRKACASLLAIRLELMNNALGPKIWRVSSFTTSSEDRYFEDYIAGAVHEFGSIGVSEKEVIEFGQRFVPLSYHTDPAAAKKSIYGGIIASGWDTAAPMMRLYTGYHLSKVA